jgi:hypothetical protein
MIAKVTGTLLLAALALPAYAADDIYRWVDETGRVNYGNVVPDRFKRVATKIDVSGSRVAVTNGRQNATTPVEPSASTGASAGGASTGAGQAPVTGPHGAGY